MLGLHPLCRIFHNILVTYMLTELHAGYDMPWCDPPQHGLSSNKMALITSYCDAMRTHEHQMALITSECAPAGCFTTCFRREYLAARGGTRST